MNKDIEKLYESYVEESKETEEYKNISKKLSKKYDEMEKEFTEEQLKEIEEFEQYLTSLLEIEIKSAFKGGFSAAVNLILDSRDKK